MKCTNCGKNNANYHYSYNINGEITQAHLCHECARELQPEKEFAARRQALFGSMFDDSFFGGSRLLDRFFDRDPFEGFFGRSFMNPFAMLGAPRIEISFPETKREEPKDESGGKAEVDPELARMREINALREEMRAAADREDYEEAARIRDKIRTMEKSEE